MEHLAHKETIGRYTVSIFYDTDLSLEDAVNDEPVMIFGRNRGHDREILDQSKLPFPSHAILRAIEEQDPDAILSELCDMSYSDNGRAANGRVWAEHSDWQSARNANGCRYFKTLENATAALFLAEYGRELSDLKVEQFGDYQSTYYLCFWRSEFDAYCGGKDCQSSRGSCQDIIDGNVFGFVIGDDEDDRLESCWGFIGDKSYCLDEARAIAQSLEQDAQEQDATTAACIIAAARPDLAPNYA